MLMNLFLNVQLSYKVCIYGKDLVIIVSEFMYDDYDNDYDQIIRNCLIIVRIVQDILMFQIVVFYQKYF